MLIVDEEQKFGVRHKEKLKQFRSKIDVLSLTATPIPRTLHMSLIGARDLSIMNTPPRNRLPVETTVSEFHDEIVKQAIENELSESNWTAWQNARIRDRWSHAHCFTSSRSSAVIVSLPPVTPHEEKRPGNRVRLTGFRELP